LASHGRLRDSLGQLPRHLGLFFSNPLLFFNRVAPL
jgi:hypothetical protein